MATNIMSDIPFFRTLVEVPSMGRLIELKDSHLFLGSCFAQYVGGHFQDYGLTTMVNPVGTLYNPASICTLLEQVNQPTPQAYIFQTENQYRCWFAGTQIYAESEQALQSQILELLSSVRQFIQTTDNLYLTLGTNVVYVHKERGYVVGNCHRVSQNLFSEQALSVGECIDVMSRIVALATSLNPTIRIIWTVSPYRYAKYGFHRSQLAKSTLLLAIDEMCRRYADTCVYFPSYEMVLDELRDYRFYAEDMLHPSAEAVKYVCNRFISHCFVPEALPYFKEYASVCKGFVHRSQSPDSPAEQQRLKQLHDKANAIRQRYGLTPLF